MKAADSMVYVGSKFGGAQVCSECKRFYIFLKGSLSQQRRGIKREHSDLKNFKTVQLSEVFL